MRAGLNPRAWGRNEETHAWIDRGLRDARMDAKRGGQRRVPHPRVFRRAGDGQEMNRRAWLVCAVLVGALCSTPKAGATPTNLRLLRGCSSTGDSVLVRGRAPRDQAAWRTWLHLCGCPGEWAWAVFEVRSRAAGRLVLYDARGRRYDADQPCQRWGLPPRCFAFYGLDAGSVARGEWIAETDSVAVLP